MEDHIGKTIDSVITTWLEEELIIFTDGTNTLIGAGMGQGCGYITQEDNVDTDKYIKCTGCEDFKIYCSCEEVTP